MTTPTTRTPRTHLPHAVPVAQLEQAILDFVEKKGPSSIEQIGAALCYSDGPLRKRLLDLEQAQRVHRIRHTVSKSGRGGLFYFWKFGPFVPSTEVPEAPKSRKITRGKPAEVPDLPTRQRITRAFPPVGRRDPLVSALFGPARQEAA